MNDRERLREDPTARLSPTARKLVAAARRLLARGGYEALTVEAVAAEAGAYRDSVRYYFGSKAAFVAAVVDSLSHDQSLSAVTETQATVGGDERVHGLVDADRRLVDDRAAFADFFALFPHVVLDDELRERVAALYEWYRDLYVEGLGDASPIEEPRLRRVASLMVAMTDGLAVQKLLDPDGVRAPAALRAVGGHAPRGAAPGRRLRRPRPARGRLPAVPRGSFTVSGPCCRLAACLRYRMGGPAGLTAGTRLFVGGTSFGAGDREVVQQREGVRLHRAGRR